MVQGLRSLKFLGWERWGLRQCQSKTLSLCRIPVVQLGSSPYPTHCNPHGTLCALEESETLPAEEQSHIAPLNSDQPY